MRRSNIPNKLDIWFYSIDWRGNFKGILIVLTISVCFCGAFFYSDISHAIKLQKYKGEVVGQLLSYKENKHLSQSQTGNKIKTLNYEIEYSFNVNGKNYYVKTTLTEHSTDLIELAKIRSGKIPLIVKYNIENPEENTISID